MEHDNTTSGTSEPERHFGSADELPSEPIIDTDKLIHRQENEDAPPAMPPESLEDFEKAIRGENVPRVPTIPPANPD